MIATARLVSSTSAALGLFVACAAPCLAQSMAVRPDVFDAAIRARVAALVGPPRTIELTSEKADAAKAAVMRGDYAAAGSIAGAIIAASRDATWRNQRLSLFMQEMFEPRDNGYLEKLSDWVAHDGASAIPHLIRAKNYLELGWRVRGDKFASVTRPDHLATRGRDVAAKISVSRSLRRHARRRLDRLSNRRRRHRQILRRGENGRVRGA